MSTGGADTLDHWMQHLAFILLSSIGAGLVTLMNKNGRAYSTFYYWTRIAVRYFLDIIMFSYGVQKLFMLQMTYPKLSYFYTPLGDLNPMDIVDLSR